MKSFNNSYINKLIIILVIILIAELIPLTMRYQLVTSLNIVNYQDWGLGYGKEGQQPTGNADQEYLKQYNAYYVGNNQEKVIYLTFDAGYENGYTNKLLDILKKHNVPAAFFLVANYIKTNQELVKRMVREGHLVCNHTTTHPNMSSISNISSFKKELEGVEKLYKELVNDEMTKYYRPPQGKFSENNLKQAKELGYATFFWSLAYVDWINNKQPSKEEAFSKLLNRIHPGAIILLHSNSKTNAEILDELIIKWKNKDYNFKSLDYLIDTNKKH